MHAFLARQSADITQSKNTVVDRSLGWREERRVNASPHQERRRVELPLQEVHGFEVGRGRDALQPVEAQRRLQRRLQCPVGKRLSRSFRQPSQATMETTGRE